MVHRLSEHAAWTPPLWLPTLGNGTPEPRETEWCSVHQYAGDGRNGLLVVAKPNGSNRRTISKGPMTDDLTGLAC